MLNSKIVKEAHKMAREIKAEYPEVDYKVQFGLCLSYLLNKGEVKMKEIRFSKQGIEFVFRNFKWEQRVNTNSSLVAEWKVIGIKENNKNEGFYYNAEYLNQENAFRIEFKLKGKKIGGVRLPEDIKINEIIEEAKVIALKEATEKQKVIDSKYNDTTIIDISYHTTYKFMLGEYKESTRGKKINDILSNKKIATKVEKEIEKYQTDCDMGDYSITTSFRISVIDFENIVNEVSETDNKEKSKILEAEEKRINDLFLKAKETNEPQIIKQWSEECNNPSEDCDVDNIIVYAMPDGTKQTKRYHTW